MKKIIIIVFTIFVSVCSIERLSAIESYVVMDQDSGRVLGSKNMDEKKNISNEPNLNEKNDVVEEYNLYETRKIFLDNKSWKGNDFAWIMDDKSVCLSEHGDGGPYSITDIDLPKNAKVGEVYEKIDGKYVYNAEITEEINKIDK